MNKAVKLLQSHPARLLNDFYAASPCTTCVSSYQRCSNSCAETPTLTPNPFGAGRRRFSASMGVSGGVTDDTGKGFVARAHAALYVTQSAGRHPLHTPTVAPAS